MSTLAVDAVRNASAGDAYERAATIDADGLDDASPSPPAQEEAP